MTSLMLQEACEAAAAVRRQADNIAAYSDLAGQLRNRPPPFAVTIARGSSDAAASYAAYLIATQTGLVTASLPPSLTTRQDASLHLDGALALGISQSGQSPDLVSALTHAGARGAVTAAVLNATDSPLADAAAHVLPIEAGPERSVAATKSFIASLAGIARLVALWNDADLDAALKRLPDALEAACSMDWSPALELLTRADRAMVVGRGFGLAVAQEMALKLIETSSLGAFAFSAAEVKHGPMALIGPGFPVLLLDLPGVMAASTDAVAGDLHDAGARVLRIGPDRRLPLPAPLHPALDPIVAVQAFYVFAAGLAEARGLDPDRPRHLDKVTQTF